MIPCPRCRIRLVPVYPGGVTTCRYVCDPCWYALWYACKESK